MLTVYEALIPLIVDMPTNYILPTHPSNACLFCFTAQAHQPLAMQYIIFLTFFFFSQNKGASNKSQQHMNISYFMYFFPSISALFTQAIPYASLPCSSVSASLGPPTATIMYSCLSSTALIVCPVFPHSKTLISQR